jgi:hypothetical protein
MKISLDTTWHLILDEDRNKTLLKLGLYDYESLLCKILNNTQLKNSMDNDGTYKLSKKAEKILLEEIEKQKPK